MSGVRAIERPSAASVTASRPAPNGLSPEEAARRRRKKKGRLPTWTHYPIYWGLRGFVGAAGMLGIERAAPIARAVGERFGRLKSNRKRVERAISNIGWCFPEYTTEQREELALEAYRHLFVLATEMMLAPNIITTENYPTYVPEIVGYQPVVDAMTSDRPAILIAGHQGNWEVMTHLIGLLGYRVHALYRPLDMKPLDQWARRTREANGITMIDKFGAAELLPDLMAAGENVGFVADQNAGDRGYFAPFFDRLASAYKTIGLLAIRYNADILCGQTRRIGVNDGSGPYFRYRMELFDRFGPDDWVDQPDPLFYVTARYRRAIEGMIRETPDQYLWMHRTWRSRPRHEREGKPFPSKLREKIEQLPWMTQASLDRILARSAQDTQEYVPRRA
ncbi:MAG: lysophospholipid acyltransferase family protein [Planctomycetota bacterium]